MIKNKGAFQAFLLSMVLVLFASQSQARITFEALGGELEIEGFLKSETRTRMFAGTTHLGQWIQKFQVEAALEYTDVGIFDELTFVTIVRPEYDIVMDTGNFSTGRVGDGSSKPSLKGRADFNYSTDALAFGGFDFALGGQAFGVNSTGGIGKEISHGLANANQFDEMFEVDFRRGITGANVSNGSSSMSSGFPTIVQRASNLNLDCARCTDLNISNRDVALQNTDSNGRMYPIRELYMDGVIGDVWMRIGKQQIVWGKTDFFRMQDLINPIDFGQHFFFDSFEDIRIPQWMASFQWKAGSFGPLTDNAIQFVWNFDQFQRVGLGNPSGFWAHPFSKDISTFAIYNTYFSKEPCLGQNQVQITGTGISSTASGLLAGANTAVSATDICGSFGGADPRTPAGFGTPAGLNRENRPDWDIKNTEAGFRWEFRVSDFRFALSHWYGWNDLPVFKFHTVNMPTRHIDMVAAGRGANDLLIGDLVAARAFAGTGDMLAFSNNQIANGNATPFGGVTGFVDPVLRTTPQDAAELLRSFGNPGRHQQSAVNAFNSGDFANLWNGLDVAGCGVADATRNFCSPLAGGQTSVEYKQSHTVGLSMDYFESWSGVVMRVESSWTFDEIVNNTRSVDWVDHSDIMRFSLGFDRPTFIPFLNKDRTFFLSLQIFDTWYWDHEGDKNTGYFVDEHNWITTFFFIGNYKRDTVKPIGFYVWEEASNSHVAGFNVEWLLNNHWSVKGGFHLIWEGDNNTTHDVGPYANFITNGPTGLGAGHANQYPFVTSVFGPGRQGIGALRNYDEVFFELKYQF